MTTDNHDDGTAAKRQTRGGRTMHTEEASGAKSQADQADGSQPARSNGNASLTATAFHYNGAAVRTVVVNGEPWFVAGDVCEVLDLVNTNRSVSRLDEDEKGVTSMNTLGGTQEMTIVSESGLYALILTSRKSQAKAFRRWVTGEVLPAIRKTGRSEAPGQPTVEPFPLGPIHLPAYGRYVVMAMPHRTTVHQTDLDETISEAMKTDCEIMCCDLTSIAGFWEKCRQLPDYEDLALDSVAWSGLDQAIKAGGDHGRTFLDNAFRRQAALVARLKEEVRIARGEPATEPLRHDGIKPPKLQRH